MATAVPGPTKVTIEVPFPKLVEIRQSRGADKHIVIDDVDYSDERILSAELTGASITLVVWTHRPDQIGRRVTE